LDGISIWLQPFQRIKWSISQSEMISRTRLLSPNGSAVKKDCSWPNPDILDVMDSTITLAASETIAVVLGRKHCFHFIALSSHPSYSFHPSHHLNLCAEISRRPLNPKHDPVR
jgi:hypothetical protein